MWFILILGFLSLIVAVTWLSEKAAYWFANPEDRRHLFDREITPELRAQARTYDEIVSGKW